VDFEFCFIKLPANPPRIVASKNGHGNVYVNGNGFDLMEFAVAVSKLFPIPSERRYAVAVSLYFIFKALLLTVPFSGIKKWLPYLASLNQMLE
jgi:hypothetical protein